MDGMTKVGDIIEVSRILKDPNGNEIVQPYLSIDPKTRQCTKSPQLFRVDSLDEAGNPHKLTPITRTIEVHPDFTLTVTKEAYR